MSTGDQKRFTLAGFIGATVVLYGLIGLMALKNPIYPIRADSIGYLELAHNLRNHCVFSRDAQSPYSPELFRLPGYPLFLAIVGAVNENTSSRAVIAQCLLALFMLCIVWRSFGDIRAFMVAAIIIVFDLNSLLHAGLVLAESWMQLFLVLALHYTFQSLENPTPQNYWRAGLAWGAACLIKPIALFALAGIVAALFLSRPRQAMLVLVIGMLLPGAWSIHNALSSRHPTFTSQGGYALLIPATGAFAMANHIPMSEAQDQLESQIRAENPNLVKDSAEESMAYKRKAMEVMKKYPGPTMAYHVAGMIRILGGSGLDMLIELIKPQGADAYTTATLKTTFSGSGTISLLKRFPALIPVQALYMVFLVSMYVFFALGCYRAVQAGAVEKVMIVLIPSIAILLVSCHQGYFRFRIPLMPFFGFGAALFFQHKPRDYNRLTK